jgi:CRISPR-associated endonuclease/helicase Cas3
VFLYPTRATATEGFRDYASWAGDEAALLHGTSVYDLHGMFDNSADPRSSDDYRVQERLFALGYWPRRIFSATVDSFLAFMRNQYASLCLLPVLCESVLVIDEVHSFDRSMFTALERFLKFFDIPVLCMTATLRNDLRSTLVQECGLESFPEDLDSLPDLRQHSILPRYRVRWSTFDAALRLAAASIKQGRKILWVTNTVDRCQQVARQLRDAGRVLCYHSRFRLKDRKSRHQAAIRAFQEESGPVVLVSTQVCEMSLDLDADILISETAPVSSLVQRLGRCCRNAPLDGSRIGEVLIYPPESCLPYEREEIKQGESFAQALARRKTASQDDLARYLEELNVDDPYARGGYVGFLDSAYFARAADETFREGDDFTLDCVLDDDVSTYLGLSQAGNPEAAGLVVPVPRKHCNEDARLGRTLRVAPAARYESELGFCG